MPNNDEPLDIDAFLAAGEESFETASPASHTSADHEDTASPIEGFFPIDAESDAGDCASLPDQELRNEDFDDIEMGSESDPLQPLMLMVEKDYKNDYTAWTAHATKSTDYLKEGIAYLDEAAIVAAEAANHALKAAVEGQVPPAIFLTVENALQALTTKVHEKKFRLEVDVIELFAEALTEDQAKEVQRLYADFKLVQEKFKELIKRKEVAGDSKNLLQEALKNVVSPREKRHQLKLEKEHVADENDNKAGNESRKRSKSPSSYTGALFRETSGSGGGAGTATADGTDLSGRRTRTRSMGRL